MCQFIVESIGKRIFAHYMHIMSNDLRMKVYNEMKVKSL